MVRPAIIAAATLALSTPVLAHAFLKSATPPVGSTLQAAPSAVTIDYTEAIEPKFSSIEVQDAAGTRVDTGGPPIASSNQKALTIPLKPLPPGTYKVTWHVTAKDTHKTEGTYTFTLAP